ncbi:hypothetical protein UN64_12455 [Fictibacillus arsenicus]|uniref:Uncharacterized protein n=1 Tax=Fictibacillus arsenicus TaxID=255247 RepID=A0A1V3G8V6_9BACL|nr:hypothetical protein UN64_12455 [Fictibacillus arsenicus]
MKNGSIGEKLSSSGGNSIFTGVNNRFIDGKDTSIGERVTEKRTRTVNPYKPHRSPQPIILLHLNFLSIYLIRIFFSF